MNILIVYANEKKTSYNAAMLDVAVKTFTERGDSVKVSDLYQMNFKAVADKHDFTESPDPEWAYQVAQRNSAEKGFLTADIQEETEKLLWADMIIFQFPIWWFSMPAIMKGWIDRTVLNGAHYSRGRWYSNGALKGKKAMIAMTTGGPESAFSETGINGYIKDLLFPIQHGIFHFLGMDAVEPFIVFSAAYISDEERANQLVEYKNTLLDIENRSFVPPSPIEKYNQDTWVLNT